MSVAPVADPFSAAAVGSEWLDRTLAPACELGRGGRAHAFGRGDEREARALIGAVQAAAEAFSAHEIDALRAALGELRDPRDAVSRAVLGETLDDLDFLTVAGFVRCIDRIAALGAGRLEERLPAPCATLRAKLSAGSIGNGGFYLSDDDDVQLQTARAELISAQEAHERERARLARAVAAALGVEHIRDGEFVVMRETVGAGIPAHLRVLRETPTYLLCELALDGAAERTLAVCDEARRALAVSERRARSTLSEAVGACAGEVRRAVVAVAELDAFVARVRFAQRYATALPEIADDATFACAGARYLPLEESERIAGRDYQPIGFSFSGAAVFTGPNMGGKTAALRTCGFLALCVARGLPVAARSARIPLFSQIAWLGGRAETAPQPALSSFGVEVVQMQDALANASAATLVLIDEFARTTSPREGRALLVAAMRALRARGATAVAATHFDDIAKASAAAHFSVAGLRRVPVARSGAGLDELLASLGALMDYSLRPINGAPPRTSDAIALAGALGMDKALLDEAAAIAEKA